ncbi:hypothetical protein FRC12_011593 [Ceratobasidium sp. 428]|nr:hypothetical protein FRC12_011593 [Ceratobasidium sp. 428]
MSLQPTLSFLQIGSPDAPHALEFYLGNAKIFLKAIDPTLKPAITGSGGYAGKVRVLIRLQPQPWHGSSTFLHEAAIAVGRVAPDKFWEYASIVRLPLPLLPTSPVSYAVLTHEPQVFKNQETFFDIPASTLTPTQIREKLVALVPEGVDKSKVADLLTHKTTPNGGVDVTDDLKYNIKLGRQNSIHVTPTALWDGLIANDVSSSWGEQEWDKFLSSKVLV